jgi:hypothetical protein
MSQLIVSAPIDCFKKLVVLLISFCLLANCVWGEERNRGTRIEIIEYVNPPNFGANCGIDSLFALCCTSFNCDASLTKMMSIANVGTNGISIEEMLRVAGVLNLDIQAMQTDRENLEARNEPAVLHVNGDHFVFVHHWKPEVLVYDSAQGGLFTTDVKVFESLYSWEGVAIVRGNGFRSYLTWLARPSTSWLLAGSLVFSLMALSMKWCLDRARGRNGSLESKESSMNSA